jgi:hypothetical protein
MTLSNSTYDKLKFVALVVLPALAAFVVAFNSLWDIPNQDAIVGTIAAVDTFLGALLGVSSNQYQEELQDPKHNDGYLEVTGYNPDTGHPDLAMTIVRDPNELVSKDVAKFKIGSPPPQAR